MTLEARLQTSLADRYVLGRELGRGGMATVFLAHDLRHDRPVALKVLHPELAHALGPERFQREIKIAARLQHPHILSVHDSGEAAGHLWFTMPFVEGESLRDRLKREKQLPVETAVAVAQDVAAALAYAHSRGVIHRDVKPENIMLAGDEALVADFGIARSLGADQLTQTGLTMGTPAYMSPEQAVGERQVDPRSDVYALGCVLYEMLSGEPPFAGPTPQAILARALAGSPRPIRPLRVGVSPALDAVIAKALAVTPADRHSSMEEFARALTPGPGPVTPASSDLRRSLVGSRSVVAVLVLGILALASLFAWQGTRASRDGVESTLVAVLPFENLGAPEDEYFADGITDAIRGKLTAIPGLRITARGSSMQYRQTAKTPGQIGEELGVQYLLTGTVRWQKRDDTSRVQVTPELIQVATGSSKWQQSFDAALTDVFQVQADIAGQMTRLLDVVLGDSTRGRLSERPTRSLAAYDAYLKGEEVSRGASNVQPTALRRALAYYEQAVARDSTFAQAWVQLSRAHSGLYYNSSPTPEGAATARRAAERALALAPGDAEGRLALGDYYTYVVREYASALEQYALGIQREPYHAQLLTAAALVEQRLGRWAASLGHLTHARTVDPRSIVTAWRTVQTLLWLRRYSEALAASDQALALAPSDLDVLLTRAMVYLGQGDLNGARTVLRTPPDVAPAALVAYFATYWDLGWALNETQQGLLLQLGPAAFDGNRAAWAIALAQVHANRGDTALAAAFADSARAELREQLEATPGDAQLHAFYGLALAYLGDRAEAVSAGSRSVALTPLTANAYEGPYYQHQLARIHVLVGESEKALDQLEMLVKIPYFLSPGWLRIDPAFQSLRGNPRFGRLARGT